MWLSQQRKQHFTCPRCGETVPRVAAVNPALRGLWVCPNCGYDLNTPRAMYGALSRLSSWWDRRSLAVHIAVIVAVVALLVVVTAVSLRPGPGSPVPGGQANSSPTATPRTTTIVLPVPVGEKAIAEEAATIFETRLQALGIGTFTSSIGNNMHFNIVLPPSVSAADVDAVLHTAGRLEFLAWSEGMQVVTVGETVPDGIPVLFDQSHITSVALTTANSTPRIPAVELHLDALATQALATYTATHISQPGPIALDGKVVASPIVQSAITDGDLMITFATGSAEPGTLSAAAMAAILQSGPLPEGWTVP